MQRDNNGREMIRSRTTMSYAFEGALQRYLTTPTSDLPPLVVSVAQAIRNGFRTRPSWTVSKRENPKDRKGRRR